MICQFQNIPSQTDKRSQTEKLTLTDVIGGLKAKQRLKCNSKKLDFKKLQTYYFLLVIQ